MASKRHPQWAGGAVSAVSCLLLVGCLGSDIPVEKAGTPIGDDLARRQMLAGPGDTLGNLFGGGGGGASEGGSGAQIGVNALLWRASLDTVSFMPLASADPFGGVIITDWYSDPATPNERFKATVYILDQQLRADAVRVSLFRQQRRGGGWVDAAASPAAARQLEDQILTRARQMRIAQVEGG